MTYLDGPLHQLEPLEQEIFRLRFEQHFEDVLRPLTNLYGHLDDFDHHLGQLLHIVACAYRDRPAELRLLNLKRSAEPDWFQQSNMIGYVCYTDRFAGKLDRRSRQNTLSARTGHHLFASDAPAPAPIRAPTTAATP
jgi:hypothetical protein